MYVYYKKLAYVIVEVDNFQDLELASWGPR